MRPIFAKIQYSLNTSLGTLSHTLGEKTISPENLQSYVHDQLWSFRLEILKYNEVSVGYQKARQENEHLNKQLEVEKKHHKDLNERVNALVKSESDLKLRSSQLETELITVKQMGQRYDPRPLDVESEVLSLRSHLGKAGEELKMATQKLSDAEELRQGAENTVAVLKVSILFMIFAEILILIEIYGRKEYEAY